MISIADMKKLRKIAEEVKKVRGRQALVWETYKHKRDDFLYTVLVEDLDEWIVWNYNEQSGGLFQGFYGNEQDARCEYAKRSDRRQEDGHA